MKKEQKMKQNKFRLIPREKNTFADPECPLCKGYGNYWAIHCDDYEEFEVLVSCHCVRQNPKQDNKK